jgi:hypothetical protein
MIGLFFRHPRVRAAAGFGAIVLAWIGIALVAILTEVVP